MKVFGLGVVWGLVLAGCELGRADAVGTPSVSDDAPAVEWHVGYGTPRDEHVHEGMQTADGGYIGVGKTLTLPSPEGCVMRPEPAFSTSSMRMIECIGR